MNTMMQSLKTAFFLLLLLTIVTGIFYPGIITLYAQVFFSNSANGHWIYANNKIIGEKYIGQPFTDPNYFWSRPSATADFPYNAAQSSGSNLGPSNPQFVSQLQQRIAQFKKMDPTNQPIPIDLITTSASGLDPEISVQAALYQVPRIARLRHISEKELELLIYQTMTPRFLKILGEPTVHVLTLNRWLDREKKLHA